MMSKRTYSSISRCILWWGFLAICSGTGSSLAQSSQAVVKDVNYNLQDVGSVASAEDASAETLSQQWHAFLWDSLPPEWLQDSNQAAMLQAYQENDWKPLFISTDFEVKASGYILLQRLETVQNEAIDPRPYMLEDIRRELQNLERLRRSFQTADLAYRGSGGGSSNFAPQQEEPSQGNQNAKGPSWPVATDLEKARDEEERYRKLFLASSAVDVRLAHNLVLFANTMNPFAKEQQASALLGTIPMEQFLKDLEPSSPAYAALLQAFQECRKGSRQGLTSSMIAQVLQSYRKSHTRIYQRYVWVNIPQFTLEYRNGGKIEAVHRVIVGKANGKKIKHNGRMVGENQTPTLASSIERVVINPKWYPTERIRLELAGAIAADPSFLARNGYIYTTFAGEPRLIQLPGDNNALGRVRFDFPNVYAVYMHDTPSKNLFQRTRRDSSHGCIRVERALDLAKKLLASDQNAAASRMDSALATNRETFFRLREPVPIIIEYLPIVVNAKGDLVFCGDPYGWFPESSKRKS
jgi:murein L,D-transpeptidase YcbB/YkuD